MRRGRALRDLSITVGHGERVAIVGPNGCGKTTLLGLIPRLFDPDAGEDGARARPRDDRRARHPRLSGAEPPPPDRRGHAGDRDLRGHDRQQHRLRHQGRDAGGHRAGGAAGARTASSPGCRRATTRWSVSRA
ncbi:MAG: ATP-binding protein [Planctomycetota bacterium]|nr:MAG: ATP-binding protein [Planctomycetota bacterium]